MDIPLWGRPSPSVLIHYDSQATIGVAKGNVYNGKKRHIKIRHESMRHQILNDVLPLKFIRSEWNLVDPLTIRLKQECCLGVIMRYGFEICMACDVTNQGSCLRHYSHP